MHDGEVEFLCGLDLPEVQVLSRRTRLRVPGWILVPNGPRIEGVSVVAAGHPVRTAYPESRPDVGRYYPNIAGAELSGFLTRPLDLQPGTPEVELRVMVTCAGRSHEVLARRVRLDWYDPEGEMYRLGRVAPFDHPVEWSDATVPAIAGASPLFVLGTAPAGGSEPPLADAGAYHALLRAIVAAHDAHLEHRRVRIDSLAGDLSQYTVCRFDFAATVAAMAHAAHQAAMAGLEVDATFDLRGKQGFGVVPLLARLYPDARFGYVPEGLAQRWRDFARAKWEALHSGRVHASSERRYDGAWWGRTDEALLGMLQRFLGERQVVRMRSAATASGPRGAEASPAPRAPAGFPWAPSYDEPRPIFILGAGRSGTSAVVGALRAAGLPGAHEGHVFPLVGVLVKRVAAALERGDGSASAAGPAMLRALVASVVERCFDVTTSRPWIDKTPDHAMIEAVPLIAAIFPHARFIAMRRHPIAFALSRERKFGDSPVSAINEWVKCVDTWEAVKGAVDAAHRFECDADTLKHPATHAGLSDLCELDAAQRKALGDYLSSERAELTRAPADVLRQLDDLEGERLFDARRFFFEMLDAGRDFLDDAPWSSQQKAQVRELLGPRAAALGYILDRPAGFWARTVMPWARDLADYRHTAQFHERNAAYWAEMARRSGAGST